MNDYEAEKLKGILYRATSLIVAALRAPAGRNWEREYDSVADFNSVTKEAEKYGRWLYDR